MKFLALLLALTTQYKIVMRQPNTEPVDISDQTTIPLPTTRYECKKVLENDEAHAIVRIDCTEAGKPAISVGAICYTQRSDSNVSAFTLNVAPVGKPPQPVFFMLGCQTTQGPQVL